MMTLGLGVNFGVRKKQDDRQINYWGLESGEGLRNAKKAARQLSRNYEPHAVVQKGNNLRVYNLSDAPPEFEVIHVYREGYEQDRAISLTA